MSAPAASPTLTPIAIDFETFRIGPDMPIPPAVCVSLAEYNDQNEVETALVGNNDKPALEALLRSLLEDETILLIAHNAAFDMGVICRTFPALQPLVFAAYENERVACTQVREKLLDISDHGSTGKMPTPDGGIRQYKYNLATLVMRYLGLDRTASKTGEDIWRMNYDRLDGKPVEEYPTEAVEYAKTDALDALTVWRRQEDRKRGETGPVSMATQSLRAAAAFGLSLITEHGMRIDAKRVHLIEEELKEICSDENLQILYTSGIMRPAEDPRPKKRKAPKIDWHVDDLSVDQRRELIRAICQEFDLKVAMGGKGGNTILASPAAFTRTYNKILDLFAAEGIYADKLTPASTRASWPHFSALLARAEVLVPLGEQKLTQGKAAGVNRIALAELVHSLRRSVGLPPIWTDPKEKDPDKQKHSTSEAAIEDIAHLSPVLRKYMERNSITKILTTELPRMRNEDGTPAAVVRFNFGLPIDSGRTSSFAGTLYPSANGQNIYPPVRPCYMPREGWLLASVDYSSIELVSAAETCLRLFSHSHLADIILAGKDPHGYLGNSLALRLDSQFASMCQAAGLSGLEACFTAFERCKKAPEEELRAFYKKYRTLAKPTGLGYWGGLGAARFVGYSKSSFGIEVEEETAKTLKEVWKETFPETVEYFKWVTSSLKDPSHPVLSYDDFGKPREGYAYSSPLGMWRAACAYTEACNGNALQTPTADGAMIAIWSVVRACHDPSADNQALYGCRPVNFLHDEILIEIPDDAYAHDRAMEVSRLMVESMKQIFQVLPVKAEPALMRRWHKEADPVYGSDGRLIPWEPSN